MSRVKEELAPQDYESPVKRGPRPYETKFTTNILYHEYECAECGKTSTNTYSEPNRTDMLQRELCFHCNYWRDFEIKLGQQHTHMTIISGHVYGPGDRTSGSFRGMAGRRFDIEYIDPSAYAGKRISTFDLWSGSALPETLAARYPDTAKFLGGAHRAQVGETGCWNPSEDRSEPYPLPRTLGGLK